MPKVNGILESSLYVNDLERSLKFYRDLFDFQVIAAVDRLVALAAAKNQNSFNSKREPLHNFPKGPPTAMENFIWRSRYRPRSFLNGKRSSFRIIS